MPVARHPEAHGVQKRFTQDHLIRPGDALRVPDALVRAGQIQMFGRTLPEVIKELAAIGFHHMAIPIKDRHNDGPGKMLVPALPQEADLLQAPTLLRTRLAVLRSQPVAERAVRQPQPEGVDQIRMIKPATLKPGQGVRIPFEGLVVIIHNLQSQLMIALGVEGIQLLNRRAFDRCLGS